MRLRFLRRSRVEAPWLLDNPDSDWLDRLNDRALALAQALSAAEGNQQLNTLTDFVEGAINIQADAGLLRGLNFERSAEATATSAQADASQANAAADRLDEQATEAEGEDETLEAEVQASQAELQEARANLRTLDVLSRVAIKLGFLGAIGTAVGAGTLVYLAAQGVTGSIDLGFATFKYARFSLTLATVLGLLLTEALVGNFLAALYERTAENRRAILLWFVIAVTFASVVATEGIAVGTRDNANQEQAKSVKQIVATGDVSALAAPPHLWWTAPLMLLLYSGGTLSFTAKALGRDGQDAREAILGAAAEHERTVAAREAARQRAIQARERAVKIREAAVRSATRAQAEAASAKKAADTITEQKQIAEDRIKTVRAEAQIEYTVAANGGGSTRRKPRDSGSLGKVSFGVFAGAAASAGGLPVAGALAVGAGIAAALIALSDLLPAFGPGTRS